MRSEIPAMAVTDCYREAYVLIKKGETERAMEICSTPSCSSSLECQNFLGREYFKRNDTVNALHWFGKAAEAGDGEGLFGVGNVHFRQRNFAEALRYYKLAVEHGSSRAYGWIGCIYEHGLGVPKDIDAAIDCYEKSAKCGYLMAERALIHLVWQRGNLVRKIAVLPRFLYVLIKAGFIAFRDIHDPRLSDIPNLPRR